MVAPDDIPGVERGDIPEDIAIGLDPEIGDAVNWLADGLDFRGGCLRGGLVLGSRFVVRCSRRLGRRA